MECFYFISETTRPSGKADHNFGTVTLCLQKIRKFIAKRNTLKSNITLKPQDSGERSGPNAPLV